MTFNVSPLSTSLSPPVKSPAENKIPEVPLSTVHRNAPAIVTVAFMTNYAGEAEFEITEGLAVVAVPKTAALRAPA